ncbi:MAG: hypothetical protein Ct9H300mP19_03370 [Dehalococcoidia bacterium]|nr:MAG: hypothetical protein Ct9H300mP19_03370 [Dehalococcoidia bacterium]
MSDRKISKVERVIDFERYAGSFGNIGSVIRHLSVVPSTMDMAWEMAREVRQRAL